MILSRSVHSSILITQTNVETTGCSPLNTCDELLSDAQGSSSGGFHHHFHTLPLTSHRLMNSTLHRIWCTHGCSHAVLGVRTWAAYLSSVNWSSCLHPLYVLCLYNLFCSFSVLILFSWFFLLYSVCWFSAFSQRKATEFTIFITN